MRDKLTRRGSVAVIALLGVAATVGVGYAAIPSADGIIHSCYTTQSGQLRVIDAEAGAKCTKNEKALDFNQRGPKGDPGAQGEPGPQGDPGPTGATMGYFASRPERRPREGMPPLTLEVPAGRYAISARVRVHGDSGQVVPCGLSTGDEIPIQLGADGAGVATLMDTATFDSATTIELRCDGGFELSHQAISAIEVTAGGEGSR